MEMEDGEKWTVESWNALSWNEIRGMCKKHGIKAAGKKPELVAKLTDLLVKPPTEEAVVSSPDSAVDKSVEEVNVSKEDAQSKPAAPSSPPVDQSNSTVPIDLNDTRDLSQKMLEETPEEMADETNEEVEILVKRTTVTTVQAVNTTITLDETSSILEPENMTEVQSNSTAPIGLNDTRDLGQKMLEEMADVTNEEGEITDDEEPKAAAPKDLNEIPELNADELMDVEESTDDSLLPSNDTFRVDEPLNSTYTKSDETSKGESQRVQAEVSANLSRPSSTLGCATEGTVQQGMMESAPRMEVARVDHEHMDYRENSPPTMTTPLASSYASRSRIPRLAGSTTDRFGDAHKKHFDSMPSIEEDQKSKKERMKNLLDASDTIKRLAMPKSQSPSRRALATPVSANPSVVPSTPSNVFQFRTQAASEPPSPSHRKWQPASARRPREDPKSFTKRTQKEISRAQSVIPATIPDCSDRINQLATPKSAGPVSISRERRNYTPKTGRYVYQDTMKLSNADYGMLKRQERLQNVQQQKRK